MKLILQQQWQYIKRFFVSAFSFDTKVWKIALYTLSLSATLKRTFLHTHSLFHTHVNTSSLPLSLWLTHTHIQTYLSSTYSHVHMQAPTLRHPLCLSLIHKHTHTQTISHSRVSSLKHPRALSLRHGSLSHLQTGNAKN